MNLGESCKQNRIFLGLWLATVVLLTIALCVVDKASLHLALCDHHTPWADALMPVLSDFANWLPYLVAVVLLIVNWRAGLFLTGSLLLSTGLVQLLKHLVCAPRPLTWFAENYPDITLPLTEGVTMNYWLSFPSGHTTTFFCLFFALCVIGTQWLASSNLPIQTKQLSGILLQVVSFILTVVCSYSRIYLSQHFAADVLGGMILGVISVVIVGLIFHLSGTAISKPKPECQQ